MIEIITVSFCAGLVELEKELLRKKQIKNWNSVRGADTHSLPGTDIQCISKLHRLQLVNVEIVASFQQIKRAGVAASYKKRCVGKKVGFLRRGKEIKESFACFLGENLATRAALQ